jgi:hypothetical protein
MRAPAGRTAGVRIHARLPRTGSNAFNTMPFLILVPSIKLSAWSLGPRELIGHQRLDIPPEMEDNDGT